MERHSLPGCMFTHSCLIQSSIGEALTFWMHNHPISSVVLVKHWRGTHILDVSVCSSLTILVSDSDLVKHGRGTHSLNMYSTILISGFDLPLAVVKHWKALTAWIQVHPFLSVVLIQSVTERHSQAGYVFTQFCQ